MDQTAAMLPYALNHSLSLRHSLSSRKPQSHFFLSLRVKRSLDHCVTKSENTAVVVLGDALLRHSPG